VSDRYDLSVFVNKEQLGQDSVDAARDLLESGSKLLQLRSIDDISAMPVWVDGRVMANPAPHDRVDGFILGNYGAPNRAIRCLNVEDKVKNFLVFCSRLKSEGAREQTITVFGDLQVNDHDFLWMPEGERYISLGAIYVQENSGRTALYHSTGILGKSVEPDLFTKRK
jgi:hypothetical protein